MLGGAQEDRRTLICRAAVDILAEAGPRGLTHHAVDRRLGLPLGSASYYVRTRQALLSATADWLSRESRSRLEAARHAPRDPAARRTVTPDDAADLIASQLLLLLTERRSQALARAALLGEPALDPGLKSALSSCLFSAPAATELFLALGAEDPGSAAQDLVTFLEGLLIRGLWDAGQERFTGQRLRSTVRRFLTGRLSS